MIDYFKKRLYILIGMGLLALFIHPLTIFAQTAMIDTDDLLVRGGPGTSYEPIGHVNTGDQFTIEAIESPWLQITYNNTTGWVHEDYVTISSEPAIDASDEEIANETPTDTPTQTYPYETRISIPLVHVRQDASLTSEITHRLNKNDPVTITDEQGDWYQVAIDNATGYIKKQVLDLTLTKPVGQSPLLNKTIVIDPGHGGIDVGAISLNDEYESQFAMQTGRVLERYLKRQGANVVFTRDDDYYYSLTSRATLSNYLKSDMFLSLHYNSEPAYPSANGINTYYREPGFETLAETVHHSLLEETSANDRGVASGNYSVLRNNRRPSLLLELGFLSNNAEEQMIKQASYHEKLAKGITDGVTDYFETRP
ncbi:MULTISPECIES: N-acetylmuramoyl-L-alanine amidase [Halolactibacillus]|nr:MULTISPECIES: N-acetylmuramoyl-L-alanine amidase [Halolactibacillus]